jgi:hypothetical protein
MLKLKENNIATMHAEDEEKTHNKNGAAKRARSI